MIFKVPVVLFNWCNFVLCVAVQTCNAIALCTLVVFSSGIFLSRSVTIACFEVTTFVL